MPGLSTYRPAAALAIVLLALACGAEAAVTAQEADALGTTLTGGGAEKAASADGRIPAYTGGLPTTPVGSRQTETNLADPFADEKPLRILTGSNVGDAASELTAGARELLQRYPGFRMDVYPTHRTVAYPEWLLANTRRNATTARVADDGLGLANALPGVPFPIPANGREVMWNHRLRYMGQAIGFRHEGWLVNSAGESNLSSSVQSMWGLPIFDPKRTKFVQPDEPLYCWKGEYSGPQRRAGEAHLMIEAVDLVQKGRTMWAYLPGQRRVRPVDYPDDAPQPSSSGTYLNDDMFVYTGALDRYDLKLLGKRELLIPYNAYRFAFNATVEEVLRPGHLNPDLVRWELHRVWVVEATLKPGQHHVYGRRVFYVDEDSWTAIASDEYDPDGKLLRALFAFPAYDYRAGVPFAITYAAYDFSSGAYFLAFFPGPHSGLHYLESWPESTWSPDSLAGAGVR